MIKFETFGYYHAFTHHKDFYVSINEPGAKFTAYRKLVQFKKEVSTDLRLYRVVERVDQGGRV